MKSNVKKIATAGLLSATLLVGSIGIAASANGTAYEDLKAAAFETVQQRNYTGKVNGKLIFDGEVLADITSVAEMSEDGSYNKNEGTVLGKSSTYEHGRNAEGFYVAEDGKVTMQEPFEVMFDEDGEYMGTQAIAYDEDGERIKININENGEHTFLKADVEEGTDPASGARTVTVRGGETPSEDEDLSIRTINTVYFEDDDRELSPSTKKLMGMVMDILVGDVKTHFTSSGDDVQVSLDGAQIPEIANVALNAFFESQGRYINYLEDDSFDAVFYDCLKTLSEGKDMHFKSVSYTGSLDGGMLSDNTAKAVIVGTDKNGNAHELVIDITADVTNVGTTQVTDMAEIYGKGAEAYDSGAADESN